ncbi:MAG: YbaB/EbfC family nucleoid-associated protein [Treponema sp.]|jgi:DNA-binding YbaB/EbfC family protein|nr:YbaB/EbfC family nucleoid-associated protein [Treponema sp.]
MNINPFDILKNAQKIQEQMNGFQEKLGDITATGSAAAGLVEIDINGKLDVIAIRISPQTLSDVEMLQDLIMAAFTDGMAKVKEAISSQVGSMAGGLDLSGFQGE